MKKLLLFCFLVNSGLMGMNGGKIEEEILSTLPEKIALTINHFALVDGHFNLTEQAGDLLYENSKDSDGIIKKVRVKELLNDIAAFSFSGGRYTGFSEGKAFKSFYDSKPKIAGLAIVTIIILGSVVYTGKTLFCKFKKWRSSDTE